MWWMVGGVMVLVVLAVGSWLLGPSLKALVSSRFEPTAKDEASIDRALQSGSSAGKGD